MKIIRNGVTYELTNAELEEAFREKEKKYHEEDIIGYCENNNLHIPNGKEIDVLCDNLYDALSDSDLYGDAFHAILGEVVTKYISEKEKNSNKNRKTYYQGLYADVYSIEENKDGSAILEKYGAGYLVKTSTKYKTVKGAKVSLARWCNGMPKVIRETYVDAKTKNIGDIKKALLSIKVGDIITKQIEEGHCIITYKLKVDCVEVEKNEKTDEDFPYIKFYGTPITKEDEIMAEDYGYGCSGAEVVLFAEEENTKETSKKLKKKDIER